MFLYKKTNDEIIKELTEIYEIRHLRCQILDRQIQRCHAIIFDEDCPGRPLWKLYDDK